MSRPLSVVVVAYDMGRELPRTLRSLTPPLQRDIAADEYEIVVVDNGSPAPVRVPDGADGGVDVRVVRVDPAPASPAQGANAGLAGATGELVGLVIDGARLASPGLLAGARRASRIAPRCVITSPSYHLGSVRHMDADAAGYDQEVEDALLAESGWEDDGYRLFDLSTFAASSARGWFGPMGESSALFMPPALWHELGGLDERFTLPGGGLVNHDLYRRACALPDVELIVLLGEGTFHQIHGGAATARRYTWDEMHAQYQTIRNERYRPPQRRPLYIGAIPDTALSHLERSVELAHKRRIASRPRKERSWNT